MTYAKQSWRNGDATTPISGPRLQNMEDGIDGAHVAAAAAATSASNAQATANTAKTTADSAKTTATAAQTAANTAKENADAAKAAADSKSTVLFVTSAADVPADTPVGTLVVVQTP